MPTGLEAVTGMSDEEFEEFCRGQARENLQLLMPIVEKLHGSPVRQVAVWFAGFLIPMMGEMDRHDRQWVAAVLRRAADFVEKNGKIQN